MGLGIANHGTQGMVAPSALITRRMSFLLLLVLKLSVQVSCQKLTSTLHSTEYGLKFAYDGEIIRFTCVVEGNSMAWSSDEYIGSDGDRLEFVSIESKGTEYRVGQTVATLVNVSNVNGKAILESQLQISAQYTFQISSIRCHNIGSDTVNTILFGTNGNTSITCDQLSACPGEIVTCTCITGYSNILAWSSDQLIGPNDARLEFLSIDAVNTTINVPSSNTRAVLTDISRQNGVLVLSSDLTFVANNPANILTCVNVGQDRRYSKIIPMSTENCGSVSTSSLSTTSDLAASIKIVDASSSPHSDNSSVTIGVSVFLCIIVIILVLAIIMLVIKMICVHKKDVTDSYKDRRGTDLLRAECVIPIEDTTQENSTTVGTDIKEVNVPDVDMVVLVAAIDTQKEILQEIQERNRNKNSENTTGGLKKRAQANKDSKEE